MSNKNTITLQLVDSYQHEIIDDNGRRRKVWPQFLQIPDTDTRYRKDENGVSFLERAVHSSQKGEGPGGVLMDIKEPIVLIKGKATYDKELSPHTHEFIQYNSHNESAPNRKLNAGKVAIFKILDLAKEKEIEGDIMLTEARVLAKFDRDHKFAYTNEQILSYAIAKGFDVENTTMASIRRDAMISAKKDPTGFDRDISDAQLKYEVYIRQSIEFDIIKLDGNKRWTWSSNGRIITGVPSGINEFDHIRDYCLTNPQGNIDLKEIVNRVDIVLREKTPRKNKTEEQRGLESFEMKNVMDPDLLASKKDDQIKKQMETGQKKKGNPNFGKKKTPSPDKNDF